MKKNYLTLFFIFYFLFFIFLWLMSSGGLAQTTTTEPGPGTDTTKSETLNLLNRVAKEAGKKAGIWEKYQDPILTVVLIINYLLGFLGVVFLLIIVWGGILWMTAAGNEEKVGKAKKTLQSGLVGLVIILLSYVIYNFVVELLKTQGGSGGPGTSTSPGP